MYELFATSPMFLPIGMTDTLEKAIEIAKKQLTFHSKIRIHKGQEYIMTIEE